MLRKTLLFLFASTLLILNESQGQDPQFSQYYAAPLYLNPALAGINQLGRAGVNYRNQWPSIDASFETFSAYVDVNFDEKNSSVGLMVTSDQEGIAGLTSTEIALQYAYQVRVNYKWTFRPAIQASYTFRDLNFNRLTFGDQIDANGLNGNPTAEQFDAAGTVHYWDLGVGGIVFSDRIWFGASMHHLREPDQSFLGDGSPLPRKLSLHGGYRIPLRTGYKKGETAKGMERSLSPTFNYRTQGEFDQLDVGMYFTWQPVIFGLWYRGIPIKTPEGSGSNTESLIFMFGVTQKKLTFGYSFDYTLSNLGIATGGAHEVSITYTFKWGDPRKPSRDVRELKCPVPYMF
ncbi:PorP/SprF family type IX secretion system membrane protein [Reichenbachiella ulvae]|uniref:Type IX secretion system membrane protein PorP/SprF n=1 Tax=Reichenbachiella ulvae TaxID=2980104 RepID=A0ABT3CP06_9BACT|nr:type IX secretion system membrane protein PorP/SprF [Reichenbachiella ulvae]MCV9385327.1 type IX secretion system membrane protein PorP/SprF [Reichenbachiella ulvae]